MDINAAPTTAAERIVYAELAAGNITLNQARELLVGAGIIVP